MSIQTTTPKVSITPEKNKALQFKGGLYTLTAIQLYSSDLSIVEEQLHEKIQQAPKFFKNAPVVIDLQKLNDDKNTIDFKQLRSLLEKRSLIPVGIKSGNPKQQEAAIIAGFAVLLENSKDAEKSPEKNKISLETKNDSKENLKENRQAEKSKNNIEENRDNDEIKTTPTKVITQPVRSGQQIYARHGDLIVLAPVSHGAELLADGHIHVYGCLRGRALAGVTGDTEARIFCHSLEAELISIAGQYKISEDIEESYWKKAVEIFLSDDHLQIRSF